MAIDIGFNETTHAAPDKEDRRLGVGRVEIPDGLERIPGATEESVASFDLGGEELDYEALAAAQQRIVNEIVGNWDDWRPIYTADSESHDRANRQLAFLIKELDGVVPDSVIDASANFFDNTYAEYLSLEERPAATHAFVVPSRLDRSSATWSKEGHFFLPLTRYTNPLATQAVLSNTPPLVLDKYRGNEDGEAGVAIFAPVFADMMHDVKGRMPGKYAGIRTLRTARDRVTDAVRFARDGHGTNIVGLGATLPGLMKFGRALEKERVVTTTGHGGTVWLIGETMARVEQELMDGDIPDGNVAVIGAGSIGASTAEYLLDHRGDDLRTITMYDTRQGHLEGVVDRLHHAHPGKVIAARGPEEAFANADIIISAVTRPMDLHRYDLRGKVIVDDSQPPPFSREDVRAAGGEVVWPIGADGTVDSRLHRVGAFNYASLAGNPSLWGCEAEVAAIAAAAAAGEDPRKYAINDRVTAADVHRIAELFDRPESRVIAGRLQSYGSEIDEDSAIAAA